MGELLRVRVGCEFRFEVGGPTPTVFQVLPRDDGAPRLLSEAWDTSPSLPFHDYRDVFQNRCRRVTLPPGLVTLRYDATVALPGSIDPKGIGARQVPVEELPDEAVVYTLPSRYCQSDLLMQAAWDLFGRTEPGWARVQAVCDWVHENVRFEYGASTPATSAVDVFARRVGVCRDFTHLAVTLCRALNVPARYVFGYLPDIDVPPPDTPMDFCAWLEAYVGDRWWTFDPRNNAPRAGRILIGRGRDAVDVAMATSYGAPQLAGMIVWADEVPETTADDAPTTAAPLATAGGLREHDGTR